jgi:hypothetical protein
MPESGQPSRGWKWSCNKAGVDSFGVGPELQRGEMWRRIDLNCDGTKLSWGFPFWDKEKLEIWKIIKPSPKVKWPGKTWWLEDSGDSEEEDSKEKEFMSSSDSEEEDLISSSDSEEEDLISSSD